MTIEEYERKRNFASTPEPSQKSATSLFVVQLHDASHLHYDFRLQVGDVLKSWAIPKGPTINPNEPRLAIRTEDHPVSYSQFEGVIPSGNYGAGTVMIWDRGSYRERNAKTDAESQHNILQGLDKGHITVLLSGERLRGEFALVQRNPGEGKHWLMTKKVDIFSSTKKNPFSSPVSIISGKSLIEICAEGVGATQLSSSSAPIPSKMPMPSPSHRHIGGDIGLSDVKEAPFLRSQKSVLITFFPYPFGQVGWLYQVYHNGFRCVAYIDWDRISLKSRQQLSLNQKFPKICQELAHWNVRAILDGEIVQRHHITKKIVDGRKGGTFSDWVYLAFDLIYVNNKDIRNLPLDSRIRLLSDIFQKQTGNLFNIVKSSWNHFNELLLNENNTEKAEILARRADGRYEKKSEGDWLKFTVSSQKAPKMGLTERSQPLSRKVSNSEDRPLKLSHLSKILWPDEQISKGHLIDYYQQVSLTILPYLRGRPQSMHRHPNGIESEGFYQKDLQGSYPRWIETYQGHHSSGKMINYLLCENKESLLYMVNLGCIEINPWLSKTSSPEYPTMSVIDLDPLEISFEAVLEVARVIHNILSELRISHLCKTSGSKGLHICIPLHPRFTYPQSRRLAISICQEVNQLLPNISSLERNRNKRRKKVYLDCFQNVKGATIASVYCVRPKPGAPVSTPLLWDEIQTSLEPASFNIFTLPERLSLIGDIWQPMLTESIDWANLPEKYQILMKDPS